METLESILSSAVDIQWIMDLNPNSPVTMAASVASLVILAFFLVKFLYRLSPIHPLYMFPGPRLGAATYMYEWWHAGIRDRNLEHLRHLHERYGPVVRINPEELHVTDKDFCIAFFHAQPGSTRSAACSQPLPHAASSRGPTRARTWSILSSPLAPSSSATFDEKPIVDKHKQGPLDKGAWYYQFAASCGCIAGIIGGTPHRTRRSEIQSLFTGRSVREFEKGGKLGSHLDRVEAWLEKASVASDQGLEAIHLLYALAADSVWDFVYGVPLGLLSLRDMGQGYKWRGVGVIRSLTIFRQWPLSYFFAIRNWRIINYLSPLAAIEKLVAASIEPLINATHCASAPVDASKNPPSLSMDPSPNPSHPTNLPVPSGLAGQLRIMHSRYKSDSAALKFETMEFALAGSEALIHNLTSTLHGLLSRPECVGRLREELDGLAAQAPAEKVWDIDGIMGLPYLNAVVKEGIRLHDSGSIRFPRESDIPVQYGDYIIPAHTTISMTETFLNYDPAIHRDPEKFDPERWLHATDGALAKRYSVAFGVGARACLGRDVALSIMTRTVAALVYDYDLSFWDELQNDGWGRGYLRLFPLSGVKGMKIKVARRVRA